MSAHTANYNFFNGLFDLFIFSQVQYMKQRIHYKYMVILSKFSANPQHLINVHLPIYQNHQQQEQLAAFACDGKCAQQEQNTLCAHSQQSLQPQQHRN